MTETIPGEQPSFANLTIDDIFTHHSVHSVLNLHKEYHNNAKKAKDDLHFLVGKKYRDLVGIAEDIEKMHETSKSIDNNLTDLSYKTPKHIPFGTSSYAKFDTHIRKQRSKDAQVASRSAIFYNIVSSTLLPFHLKLQTNAYVKSRVFVHMAKVYYTMELVFKSVMSEKTVLAADFIHYKNTFIEFLEHEIAFSVRSSNQAKTDIITHSDTQWLESDTVDFLNDLSEDEYDDDTNNRDTSESRRFSEGSSVPMYNYIVAYIILKNGDESFQSFGGIAQKIIDLRLNYLTKLIREAVESNQSVSSNLNFSFIITFAESTYSCIKKYFLEDDSSSFTKIHRQKFSWKICELIGFNNWIESELISFDMGRFGRLDPNFFDSLKENDDTLSDCILQFVQTFSNNGLNDENNSLESTRQMLSLFHNFVAACRKAEVLAESEEYACLSVGLFAAKDLPQKFLNHTVSLLSNVLLRNEEILNDQLLKDIMANLSCFSITKASVPDLFDYELINMIDQDFESYYKQVSSFASTKYEKKTEECDPIYGLIRWFNKYDDLVNMISAENPGIVANLMKILTRTYANIEDFSSWGTFDISSMTSKLSQIVQQSQASLKVKLQNLLGEITQFLESRKILEKNNLHYMLNLVHTLKTTTFLHNDESITSHLSIILRDIIQQLLCLSISDVRLEIMNAPFTISEMNESMPTAPHILLESRIERLSSKLLSSSYLGSDRFFDIILNTDNTSIFIAEKNKWILEVLVECLTLDTSTPDTTESVIDEETSIEGDEVEPQSDIAETIIDNKTDMEGDELTSQSDTAEPTVDNEIDLEGDKVEPPIHDYSHAGVPTKEEINNDYPKSEVLVGHAQQSMSNIAFLLCFTSKDPLTSQDANVLKYYERFKDVIDLSVLGLIIRGANERYRATKNIYIPLSVN